MKKILVIDDEEWLREMVHMALTQRGFQVIEAPNGAAGVDLARQEMPDLILCDVNMEKLDGYGALAALRRDRATAAIPFILMTGLADNAGMRHGMELGADDYLPKPFTIDHLYAAVEARLRQTRLVREQAEQKLADLRGNITMMLPHELRTPLNGILAYGEILASAADTLTPPELTEMGQVISASGRRLQRLVENFLIYAQLELMATDPQSPTLLRQKQTKNPAQVIERAARARALEANRATDLVVKAADTPVPMAEDYLAKMVDELTENAFKFSAPGTQVKVESVEQPNETMLVVSDRGHGFELGQVARIGAYMQFGRKMQEQQGLGLGLVIVKRLVEMHGGSLTVQSEPNLSTRVILRIPKSL